MIRRVGLSGLLVPMLVGAQERPELSIVSRVLVTRTGASVTNPPPVVAPSYDGSVTMDYGLLYARSSGWTRSETSEMRVRLTNNDVVLSIGLRRGF